MMRVLIITSLIVHSSLCCIKCTKRGKDELDKFNVLIASQLMNTASISEYTDIKMKAKAMHKNVVNYLEDEVKMLDKYAVMEVISEYKKSVDVIVETDFKEAQLLNIISVHFTRLKEKIKEIVQDSYNRKCPNKRAPENCGLMVQKYINCELCDEERILCVGGPPNLQEYFEWCSCFCSHNICTDIKTGDRYCTPCKDQPEFLAKALNCGVRNLEVPEYEDIVLACNFEWHAKLGDLYTNVFTKDAGMEPKKTNEKNLVRKYAMPPDSGQYTCMTILNSGLPVSKIRYNVRVIPGSEMPTIQYKPRPPTLPDVLNIEVPNSPPLYEEDPHKLVKGVIIAGVVVISLIVFLCIGNLCCCIIVNIKSGKSLENKPV